MRLQGLLIAIMYCFTVLSVQTAWCFTPSSTPAAYRISYGKDPMQFGDLRLPVNKPTPYPVAIIIHGGCWMSKFADNQNTAALADVLRNTGIATWNIEYRGEDQVGGGWPGTFKDVAKSADYLRNIANQYSLDLHRVIVIGHSAGGHLALWLAARHQLPSSSQLYTKNPLILRGVIVLGGVPDLKAFRKQEESACEGNVVEKLLGNTGDQVEKHFKDASPKELLPLGIPQILIYGTEDQVVPITLGDAYRQVAEKKGDTVKLIEVKYAAHQTYTIPYSVTWPVIQSAVQSLLH